MPACPLYGIVIHTLKGVAEARFLHLQHEFGPSVVEEAELRFVAHLQAALFRFQRFIHIFGDAVAHLSREKRSHGGGGQAAHVVGRQGGFRGRLHHVVAVKVVLVGRLRVESLHRSVAGESTFRDIVHIDRIHGELGTVKPEELFQFVVLSFNAVLGRAAQDQHVLKQLARHDAVQARQFGIEVVERARIAFFQCVAYLPPVLYVLHGPPFVGGESAAQIFYFIPHQRGHTPLVALFFPPHLARERCEFHLVALVCGVGDHNHEFLVYLVHQGGVVAVDFLLALHAMEGHGIVLAEIGRNHDGGVLLLLLLKSGALCLHAQGEECRQGNGKQILHSGKELVIWVQK